MRNIFFVKNVANFIFTVLTMRYKIIIDIA